MSNSKKNLEKTKKVVVITGASSGIGRETAQYFAKKGCRVFGLARRQFEIEGIKTFVCDVTDKQQVKECIEKVIKLEGQIDLIINNAGSGISGSVENQKPEDIEKMFKVNFLGTVITTQAVLPFMRKQGFGKIINTGSVAGIIPIPFQSFYSATKASVDIWAKALKIELKDFGIDVCTVLVGDTKTGFTAKREKNPVDKGTVYEKVVEKSIAKMEKDEQNGKEPITVSKVMYKLSQKKKMPPTKVVGGMYKFITFLQRIVPQSFMLWVVKKMYC